MNEWMEWIKKRKSYNEGRVAIVFDLRLMVKYSCDGLRGPSSSSELEFPLLRAPTSRRNNDGLLCSNQTSTCYMIFV